MLLLQGSDTSQLEERPLPTIPQNPLSGSTACINVACLTINNNERPAATFTLRVTGSRDFNTQWSFHNDGTNCLHDTCYRLSNAVRACNCYGICLEHHRPTLFKDGQPSSRRTFDRCLALFLALQQSGHCTINRPRSNTE